MRKAYLLLIGFILICGVPCSYSQKSEILIEDLRYDWRVYDQETVRFLPYLISENTNTIYFDVDPNKYQSFDLKLKGEAGQFLFLDTKIVDQFEAGQTKYYSIDSMARTTRGEMLKFSLYGDPLHFIKVETKIIDQNRGTALFKSNKGSSLVSRLTKTNSNVFITLTIVLLGVIVMYRTVNYRIFAEFLSIIDALSIRQRFELAITQSLFSAANLSFVGLYGLVIGVSVYSISLFDPGFQEGLIGKWDIDSIEVFSILFALIAIVLMIAKRGLIILLSVLFNFKKIRDVHFYTYFRWSLIFSLVLFLFSIMNGISEGELYRSNHSLLISLFTIALILRLLQLVVVLNSQLNFHRIQIFTYLCSTEIIPLVFFLKFFVTH